MGVRILEGENQEGAVLYCSTVDWAFGPVFVDREDAQSFLDWLSTREDRDPRNLTEGELVVYFSDFRKVVSSG